jgi:hypothetical protein
MAADSMVRTAGLCAAPDVKLKYGPRPSQRWFYGAHPVSEPDPFVLHRPLISAESNGKVKGHEQLP